MSLLFDTVHFVSDAVMPHEEIPPLTGSKNWRKWDREMKAFVIGKSRHYWYLITGTWEKPEDLTDDEAKALVSEYTAEIQLSAQRAMLLRAVRSGPTTRPATTAAMKIDFQGVRFLRKEEQSDWSRVNDQCFYWIYTKLAPHMKIYANETESAAELYAKLKQTCEVFSQQDKIEAFEAWVQWAYRGTKPTEFVCNWKLKKENFESMIKSNEHISPSVCCIMFMSAVTRAQVASVFTYNMDPAKTGLRNLEALYDAFIAAESRRLEFSGKQG